MSQQPPSDVPILYSSKKEVGFGYRDPWSRAEPSAAICGSQVVRYPIQHTVRPFTIPTTFLQRSADVKKKRIVSS
jgi:hypothetical protein